jgi:hypothetical protein
VIAHNIDTLDRWRANQNGTDDGTFKRSALAAMVQTPVTRGYLETILKIIEAWYELHHHCQYCGEATPR